MTAAGTIGGTYNDASNQGHGFLLTNGVFTTIDYPGSTASFPAGIGREGEVVGNYADAAGDHGYVKVNESFYPINAT